MQHYGGILIMNGKKSSLFLLLCALIVLFFCLLCNGRKFPESISNLFPEKNTRRNAVVRAIEKALPAVVNISTEMILHPFPRRERVSAGNPDSIGDLFDDYLRTQSLGKSYSLGSGFIIDPNGLIVTNFHVVERAARIVITLNNGKNYEAKILAGDPLNDIALLKMKDPPPSLPRILCPDSPVLYLGETVIAVGNPFGLGSSISVGALSGENRKFTLGNKILFSDILQTDAIVYPGNSGGPLINIRGEVIGMNMSAYQNAPGIGFAIPLSRVENVLATWMLPERFGDCSLGIVPGYDEQSNIVIRHVRKDSPAWNASVKPGMRILEFNGKKVHDLLALSRQLILIRSGEKITLKTPGKTFSFSAVREKPLDPLSGAERTLSLRLSDLTAEIAKALNCPVRDGMIVSGLLPDTDRRIRRGDLLIRLGKYGINSSADLAAALRNLHYNDSVHAVFLTPVTLLGRKYMARKIVPLRVR